MLKKSLYSGFTVAEEAMSMADNMRRNARVPAQCAQSAQGLARGLVREARTNLGFSGLCSWGGTGARTIGAE